MAVGLKTRRFTIAEYHRMGETGILCEDDRVELIEGEIVEMAAIGPLHAGTVDRTARVLSSRLGDRVIVRVQNPLHLPAQESEVQPDVALLRLRPDFYTRSHPEARDVYLAVEVMETSADTDRRVKLPLYAKAGVPEVWLLDLNANRVEVYRRPAADGYQDIQALQRGQPIAVEAFPDLVLSVDDRLG